MCNITAIVYIVKAECIATEMVITNISTTIIAADGKDKLINKWGKPDMVEGMISTCTFRNQPTYPCSPQSSIVIPNLIVFKIEDWFCIIPWYETILRIVKLLILNVIVQFFMDDGNCIQTYQEQIKYDLQI